MFDSTGLPEIRMRAIPSAISMPSTKEITASGIVPVSPARRSGQNESTNSCQRSPEESATAVSAIGSRNSCQEVIGNKYAVTSLGYVDAEVLLADLGDHTLFAQFGERRVDRLDEGRLVLRQGEGVQRRVVGLCGDLQAGRAVRRLIVEVREVVVDRRVDATLLEQCDGLRPAFDSFDGGAALLRERVPVARERLGGGLAVEVVEARDRVVVLLHDDDA